MSLALLRWSHGPVGRFSRGAANLVYFIAEMFACRSNGPQGRGYNQVVDIRKERN